MIFILNKISAVSPIDIFEKMLYKEYITDASFNN